MISGEVVHPRGAWRFSDPCLLTYEAERLASWLEIVANGEPLPTTCGFIEPNLEFRAVAYGQHGTLQVHFRLEARPDWALSSSAEKHELWVEFPFDELDLRALAREWRKELDAFPQRAPWPSRAGPAQVRARMRPPRFRTKNFSTCTRSPTARGSSHASHSPWDDVAFSSAERDRHLGSRPVSQLKINRHFLSASHRVAAILRRWLDTS
jgi:hypothetical protein